MTIGIDNSLWLAVPLAAVVGLGCGTVYFAAMRHSVAIFVGGGDWRRPAVLTLLRLLVAGGGFALATWFAAATLLAALAGFLCARSLALRAARRAG